MRQGFGRDCPPDCGEDHSEAVLLQTTEAPAAVGCALKNAAAHGEPTQVFFWQNCGPSWAHAWAVCCWRTAPHWSVLEEWQPGRKGNLLGGRSDRGYLLRRDHNLHCQPLTPFRAQGAEVEELGVKLSLGRRSRWGAAVFVLFLTMLLYFYLTINYNKFPLVKGFLAMMVIGDFHVLITG